MLKIPNFSLQQSLKSHKLSNKTSQTQPAQMEELAQEMIPAAQLVEDHMDAVASPTQSAVMSTAAQLDIPAMLLHAQNHQDQSGDHSESMKFKLSNESQYEYS